MNKRKIGNVELEDKIFYLILGSSLIVLFLITVYIGEEFGGKESLSGVSIDNTLLLALTPIVMLLGIGLMIYPDEIITKLKKAFLIALLMGASIYFYSFGFESFDKDLKLFVVTFCMVMLMPLIMKN